NNSERESTRGRSTNYGSGHLIQVFHDIGRIFSLPFLLSHPSPIGHPLRGRVQKRERKMVSSKAKNGFNCVSCGTHRRVDHSPNENPALRVSAKSGVSGTLMYGLKHRGAPEVPHGTSSTTSP